MGVQSSTGLQRVQPEQCAANAAALVCSFQQEGKTSDRRAAQRFKLLVGLPTRSKFCSGEQQQHHKGGSDSSFEEKLDDSKRHGHQDY